MLRETITETTQRLHQVLSDRASEFTLEETGTVTSVGNSVASITGLPPVQAEEIVQLPGGLLGIVFNLDPDEVGVILLGEERGIKAGDLVRRTGKVVNVPVGDALIGRVLDATGLALDALGPIRTDDRWPIERNAPAIMDREPVTVPLQTGITVIGTLIPIGRGQRELILGDRQTGKTAIALDTIVNQQDNGVLCVYCAIGQRDAAVAKVIAELHEHGAMQYTIVVVASGEAPAALQYITPYAATTIAEYFVAQGRDVLIVYDDLTRHARAYRELSLLLRRPPGREAYPGDIFYVHSRLLERSTHLCKELGGGSLTALPILETEAQNLSAYIPTNLISITDGQIYLAPDLFQKGMLPAVDIGKSVSRVGGKTQLPAYRAVSGPLRLSYSQFEELEIFARFGTRLDKQTSDTIEHGRRIREILKQSQYQPLDAFEQIVTLLAAIEGLLDHQPLDHVARAAENIRLTVRERRGEPRDNIVNGAPLNDEQREKIIKIAQTAAR